jgi:PAS domain S-box-containing protein
MSDNIVKRVVGIFLIMLVVLVAVTIVAVNNIHRSMASSDWVNHTHGVILEADAIVCSLQAGEAALRDYFLTLDARDQTRYRVAYTEMTSHLGTGKSMTSNEKELNGHFLELEKLLAKRVDFVRDAVLIRQKEGIEGVKTYLASDVGGDQLINIQRLVQKLKSDLNATLHERDKIAALQAQTTHWTVITGVAINFILLALSAWIISDDIAARRRAATALEEANAQLEIKVQERTAELAQTNHNLEMENLERQWSNQALEHQLRYSQLIINSINDLIIVTTKGLNITKINPAVAHFTGYETKELVYKPLINVVHLEGEQDATQPLAPIARAMREGRDLLDMPAVVVCKNGQIVPVSFSLFPVRDQNKVVGGVVAIRRVHPHA